MQNSATDNMTVLQKILFTIKRYDTTIPLRADIANGNDSLLPGVAKLTSRSFQTVSTVSFSTINDTCFSLVKKTNIFRSCNRIVFLELFSCEYFKIKLKLKYSVMEILCFFHFFVFMILLSDGILVLLVHLQYLLDKSSE